VIATVGTDGTIQFEGSKTINMTEFGMVPPTAMFGSLKTGEEITVNFKVTLAGIKG
jgi:hypothetical protein